MLWAKLLAYMENTWTVTEEDDGARLDIFLRDQSDGISRSAIAKLIKDGHATVNGNAASVHRFLKIGDTVVFHISEPETKRKKSDAKSEALPPLKIIKETAEWIVIDKPSGILVHPDTKRKTGTLVDMLVAHDPAISRVGEDPSRPGIMHRLDKEVSGLMVIAKTQDAFDVLKRQFAEHSVEKTYLALCYGQVTQDEGDIKFRIARSKNKARMAALPETERSGQVAWTHYKTVKRFQNASLLELEIYTGRTHQIRAHLLALGHPIVGDSLYTSDRGKKKIETPRLLLQAIRLSFIDPKTKQPQTFTHSPDPAFDRVIKTLSPL